MADELKEAAGENFNATLRKRLRGETLNQLAATTRFVVASTSEDDQEVRAPLMEFLASNLGTISKDVDMQVLFRADVALASDVLMRVARRERGSPSALTDEDEEEEEDVVIQVEDSDQY